MPLLPGSDDQMNCFRCFAVAYAAGRPPIQSSFGAAGGRVAPRGARGSRAAAATFFDFFFDAAAGFGGGGVNRGTASPPRSMISAADASPPLDSHHAPHSHASDRR